MNEKETKSPTYTKVRADWLRSEIEKLEGMKKECRHKQNWDGKTQLQPCACVFGEVGGYNSALTSIITRYKEELLGLEK